MANLDRTFCASPDCSNKCGRKFTGEHKITAERLGKTMMSFSYFCGEPEENKPKEIQALKE